MAQTTRWRLRAFEETDLFDTIQLANRVLDEAYSPDLFLRIAELYPDGFIVADDPATGDLLGFVMGVVSVPATARVLVLVVDPDHQRRGIGGELLEAFTRRFGRGGADRIRLEVRKRNDAAVRFYEDHGFQVEGELPRHYRDGEDAYVMTRELAGDGAEASPDGDDEE